MLCDALNSFKAKNNINVPIFLKLTSDMELDGFKKSCLQLQIHSMGLCWQIRHDNAMD